MSRTFLDALTDEEAADLHAAGRRRSYPGAVTIVHEGDDAGPVVVLLSGRAKVTTTGSAGREAIVAICGPGDLIGELSAVDSGPRSGSVTTLEPLEALLLPGSGFAALLERRPRIALVILRMVAGRLREADTGRAELGTSDVVARVSLRVLELADRFGEQREGRIEVALPMSQEELAAWAGASREAVSKALHVLRALHIIETGRRHITVLDADALRRRTTV